MAEHDIQSQDDLSGFEDYLAEFDSLLVFDNEDCPVCGVNIPEKTSSINSLFSEYLRTNSKSDLYSIKEKLDVLSIPFKIEKRLDSSILDTISYEYVVLIPLRCMIYLKNEKV
jgi:hypothetical protein